MVAGSCFQTRLPYFIGDGWDEPSVKRTRLLPTPQALTEESFHSGFSGLPSRSRRLEEYPLVVVRAPPPRDGESLWSGVLQRWDQFDVRVSLPRLRT